MAEELSECEKAWRASEAFAFTGGEASKNREDVAMRGHMRAAYREGYKAGASRSSELEAEPCGVLVGGEPDTRCAFDSDHEGRHSFEQSELEEAVFAALDTLDAKYREAWSGAEDVVRVYQTHVMPAMRALRAAREAK